MKLISYLFDLVFNNFVVLYITYSYRQRRSYSARSETNDSVFKDSDIPKSHSTSKLPSASVSKKSDGKAKRNKRAKSTSNHLNRNNSVSRPINQQNDQKEQRSSSKKPNKRRTKSESSKTLTSPVINIKNSDTQADSPLLDTPKKKRRPQQKQRQQPVISDDTEKIVRPSNTKVNSYKNKSRQSRSNSRATRRDYIDHHDVGREISAGRKASREYIHSPKKYYSQNRYNSYSQDRPVIRSNSQEHLRDSSRSASMHQNRYSNGPAPRQTRYFSGPTSHHNNFNGSTTRHNSFNGSTSRRNSFNGPSLRHNGGNNHHNVIRHNSYSNNSLSHQNGYYDGVNNRRNSFSKGSIRQEGYTNSRVFRPPRYVNGITPQTVNGVNVYYSFKHLFYE